MLHAQSDKACQTQSINRVKQKEKNHCIQILQNMYN